VLHVRGNTAAAANHNAPLALASHPRPRAQAGGAAAAAAAAPNGTAAAAAAEAPRAYKVAFVLGGPGSGKGTQSSKMVEEFGVVHLSAGDLLRAHIKSGSADGKMVAEMIEQGQIVPSSVTVGLLQGAMQASGKSQFLIDGFPRNDENRAAFEGQTGIQPSVIFFFDCPEEVMERRLLGRNEGRTDDNEATIRKRFAVFLDQSLPVVAHYEAQGKVARIAADREPDEVYKEVRRTFLEFMV
jgi:UMP-CMP kinase